MEKTSPDLKTTMSESETPVHGQTGTSYQPAPTAQASETTAMPPSEPRFELNHLTLTDSVPPGAHGENRMEDIEMLMQPLELPDARIEPGSELMEQLQAIPLKMAFKIGEAAEMVGVKQYVLRYWETEFDMLRPRKSKNNQRVYSRRDVETAMMIKKLLYDDRFSIEGARVALRQLKTHVKEERNIKAIARSQETAVAKLRGLVGEIRRIRDIFL